MKRVLVIIAFVLIAAQSANAQLLWKISGRGIEKPSYILGTHHADIGCEPGEESWRT